MFTSLLLFIYLFFLIILSGLFNKDKTHFIYCTVQFKNVYIMYINVYHRAALSFTSSCMSEWCIGKHEAS